MASEPTGLRERKKAKTRLAIADIATRLFIERGFDEVTVAEVAAAAEVSTATVFNYFDTKEDLFFDRAAEVIDAPGKLVRERAAGETIVAALQRGFHAIIERSPARLFDGRTSGFVQTIDASPALQARARLVLEETEAALARTLVEETGAKANDPTALAVAARVVGIERMLVAMLRAHLPRGQAAAARREMLAACDRAFALLSQGVEGYGKRR
jgi:AcrR family transcriptional regulator